MVSVTPTNRLLTWSLATFHTLLFLTALLLFLYANGSLEDLLSGLSTLLGLALFGALWLMTWWSTRQALAGLDWPADEQTPAIDDLLRRAALWGGLNATAFLLLFLVVQAISAVSFALASANPSSILDGIPFFLFVAVTGSAVAFAIGLVVGIFLALVDILLLRLAHFLLLQLGSFLT